MTLDSGFRFPIFDFESASIGGISRATAPLYKSIDFFCTPIKFVFDFSSIMTPTSNSGWFNGISCNTSYKPQAFVFGFPALTPNTTNTVGDTFVRSSSSGTLSQQLAQNALSYIGKVNSSAEGNRIFSGHNGKYTPWCADFVTYNVRQIYGSRLPSDFGSSSVSELQKWGYKENCYLNTRALSKNERANYIAQNVKPGDIMIEKDNGKSHTGIVTKVYSDGSFDTVEGNTSSQSRANRKVDTHHHYPNSTTLSGFITLDKFAA